MKSRASFLFALAAALTFTPASTPAQIILDDFSDLNDTADPAWVRLSGAVGSTGQSWDASSGNYRLQAPNNGSASIGFVGSYVPTSYIDSITRADFVTFGGPGNNPVFGVTARLNGDNTPGALDGYGWAYEPFAAAGAGELVLYSIVNSSVNDISSIQYSLDPAKDYTFELIIEGASLLGRVYEIGGGLVAQQSATDATYASGFSGVFGYSQSPLPPTDFTADNFLVSPVPEPAIGWLLGGGALALLVRRRLFRRTP